MNCGIAKLAGDSKLQHLKLQHLVTKMLTLLDEYMAEKPPACLIAKLVELVLSEATTNGGEEKSFVF